MNVKAFLSNNLVVLVMVPSIIGAHYTWYKLQQDDRLVSKTQRENLPIFRKNCWSRINADRNFKYVNNFLKTKVVNCVASIQYSRYHKYAQMSVDKCRVKPNGTNLVTLHTR